MSTMVEYIHEQPKALQHIFDERKAITKVFVDSYAANLPDRLYILGSGTSYNSIVVSTAFMEKILGIEVVACASSQPPVVPAIVKNPMFMIISQGGHSTNSIKVLEEIGDHPMIVITGSTDNPMANKYASCHMLLDCGEELAGPKTKGYTSSILTFYLSALEAALAVGKLSQDEYDGYIAQISEMIAALAGNIEKTFAWYRANEETLTTATKFIITGKGVAAKTSLEAALKILETVREPAIGYEFEEYLHGPTLMSDAKLCILALISEDEDGVRMQNMMKYFKENITANSYSVVNCCAGEGNDLALCISENIYLTPFAHILPAQVISALLPARLGRANPKVNLFHAIDAVVGIKAK